MCTLAPNLTKSLLTWGFSGGTYDLSRILAWEIRIIDHAQFYIPHYSTNSQPLLQDPFFLNGILLNKIIMYFIFHVSGSSVSKINISKIRIKNKIIVMSSTSLHFIPNSFSNCIVHGPARVGRWSELLSLIRRTWSMIYTEPPKTEKKTMRLKKRITHIDKKE